MLLFDRKSRRISASVTDPRWWRPYVNKQPTDLTNCLNCKTTSYVFIVQAHPYLPRGVQALEAGDVQLNLGPSRTPKHLCAL